MSSTLGVILGNRDFVPDALISEARRDLVAVFEQLGVTPVWLKESDSKLGAVETWADTAKRVTEAVCSQLLDSKTKERIYEIILD